jgi:aspartate ammonia-lyase
VHPLDHVNLHQSTNDTYPTALKIAAIYALRQISRVIETVQGALQAKEKAFAAMVTIGRTELREAVPVTLGAVFGGFAEAFSRDRWRTYKCEERLRIVPLGGTAVGTGLGAPYAYAVLVIEKLRAITGLGLTRAEQGVDQTMNMDALVESMGILQAHAVNLIKTADDLRLLSMLGEIKLPAVQAGSSLMPGKVNPVIPEAVAQAGLKAVANNGLLAAAVSRGNLQISQYMPLISDTLLETLDLLGAADRMLTICVTGITADPAVCRAHLDASPGLVTALVPEIGYARAEALIAGYDPAAGKTVRAYLSEHLGADVVDRVLAPERLLASS